MATYNITKSDGTAGPAIPDAASPDTQTDLQLVGQNAVSYGLDVAQSFYFLLENFAKDTAPAVGGVSGQLWYDKGGISTTAGLNVWNGSAWKQMASTAVGASADSMARWDDTAKTWTEETQLTLTAAGVLSILDSGLTDSVAFSHDGIDFNIAGTATADINVTGITAMNIPSITLTTALDETDGGTGTDSYVIGDILYADSTTSLAKLVIGSNGDVLTLAAGVPSWVAGSAGVASLDDLTDVTLTTPANNSILYRAAGVYIDSNVANLSFDGTTLDATQFGSGNILSANLIDRSAPGTISGVATFTNNLVMSTGNITLLDNDSIIFGTGSDVDVSFDAADLTIAAASAVDLNLTGFSGAFKSNVAGHFGILGSTGAGVRVIGDGDTDSLNEGFVSVYHNDQGQEQVRMGTLAGNTFSEVRALTADLNLYASNSLVFNLNSTETTATQGGTTTMTLHAVTGTNTSTTMGVYDDGGAERNVGYNETPTIDVGVGATYTIDIDDVGKLLTRSNTSNVAVQLVVDSDIPVGGSFLVHNDNATGTLTVSLSGTTIEWIDGSGSLPGSATKTIAYNGIATVRKKSSTVYQIWGNGIS